jgi:L-alanine-DL-glutamate epimerase-like enolase superfamily enzyme
MQIRNIKVYVIRVPSRRPVRSAVAEYDNRPAVLVRVLDEGGTCGWGEVFCNIPPCGDEHRARLIDAVLAPLVIGKRISTPPEIYPSLTRETEIIALKSGEFGPFAQCIAGIDIALWDLHAKRMKMPLWKLLNPQGDPCLKIYASGLGPDDFEKVAARRRKEGFRAFKLKIGFDLKSDLLNLERLRVVIGDDAALMADANQVWSCTQALEALELFSRYNLYWLEEPIRCNRPMEEWKQLAATGSMALAAGENLRGEDQFKRFIDSGVLTFLQPDVVKWGGISGLLPVVRNAAEKGILYCPHSFGSGVGLIASAQLLAAQQGKGWLEVDANENPLQRKMIDPFFDVDRGTITLPDRPGLGWEPNIAYFEKYIVYRSK